MKLLLLIGAVISTGPINAELTVASKKKLDQLFEGIHKNTVLIKDGGGEACTIQSNIDQEILTYVLGVAKQSLSKEDFSELQLRVYLLTQIKLGKRAVEPITAISNSGEPLKR